MSFDLISRGLAARDVDKLAAKHGAERHALGGDAWSLALSGLDDDEVVALYRALVRLAAKGGGALHNPQTGADVDLAAPGRFPGGWTPSAPVGSNLKALARSLVDDVLAAHGYQPAWPQASRDGPDLRRGVYVQLGTGSRSGAVRLQAYWTFLMRPLPHPSAMSVTFGASRFREAEGLVAPDFPSEWLPGDTPARADRAMAQLTDLLRGRVLPFLDAWPDVATLVDGVERGLISADDAFGANMLDNIADCYTHVGRSAEGRRRAEVWLEGLEAGDDAWRWDFAAKERARLDTLLP